MRPLRMLLAVVLVLGTMGASNVDARSSALSHQMMCTCGCAQILGECNHVGCPNSPGMLAALHTDVAKGMSDRAVLVAFEQQYGPTVLASPMFTALNRASWYVPPAVLILGLLGALLMLRRWRGRSARVVTAPAGEPHPPSSEALARVRRETGGL